MKSKHFIFGALALLLLFPAISGLQYIYQHSAPAGIFVTLAAGLTTLYFFLRKFGAFSVFAGILLISTMSCNSYVKPSYAGVLMTNWGNKGIEDYSRCSGKQSTFWPGTELFQVPLYEIRENIDSFGVQTNDGSSIGFRPSYTFKAIEDKVVQIVFDNRGRAGDDGEEMMRWIANNILEPRVKDAYRDIASNMSVDSIRINRQKFELLVDRKINEYFKELNFEKGTFTSSTFYSKELTGMLAQKQSISTESEKIRLEIESARARVEIARLNAEANKLNASGIDQNILRKMELENQAKLIEYWYYKGCPTPNVVSEFAPWTMLNK